MQTDEPQLHFDNLVDLFEASVARFSDRPLFGTKDGGIWDWLTYGDLKRRVDAMRGGLAGLGVGKGDRVAIIADNCVEWAVIAYATYGLGAVLVPMYETQTEKEWAFVLADSGAKVVFGPQEVMNRLLPGNAPPTVLHALPFPSYLEERPSLFSSLLGEGTARLVESVRPSPHDLACLIYTSGTTGDPKGVMLTHRNVASNVSAIRKLFPLTEEDRSLCFLPWAHAFGHTVELNGLLSIGASMALCEGVDRIAANIAEVRPSILFAVPRIFNRIHAGVQKQIAAKPKPIRWLFTAGIAAAKKRSAGASLGIVERLVLWLAGILVFSKIRAKFGGRLKYAVSGAAALAKEIAEFVDALGIVVYEGYGMTECSPVATCNWPGTHRIGSVGKAIEGVTVMLDENGSDVPGQGEFIIRGPNVMAGYFMRPEETAETVSRTGWLRTGDLGRVDADGYFYVTGRIKEQYKLENGKYVAPSPLEEQLKLSPLVANAMVYGDNRPHNVALIVVDMDALKAKLYGDQRVIPAYAPETLLADGRVHDLLAAEISRESASWKGYEKVRNFALIAEDFTQQNGMLTPTLKLRRREVLKRWGTVIDRLYP
jgi:long-chain acyl-CoA synthetase